MNRHRGRGLSIPRTATAFALIALLAACSSDVPATASRSTAPEETASPPATPRPSPSQTATPSPTPSPQPAAVLSYGGAYKFLFESEGWTVDDENPGTLELALSGVTVTVEGEREEGELWPVRRVYMTAYPLEGDVEAVSEAWWNGVLYISAAAKTPELYDWLIEEFSAFNARLQIGDPSERVAEESWNGFGATAIFNSTQLGLLVEIEQ